MVMYKATLLLIVCGVAFAAPGQDITKDVQVEEKTPSAESTNLSPLELKPAGDLKTSESQETPKETLETSNSFGLGYYAAGPHLGYAALPHALPLAVKYPLPVYATYLNYYPGYYHSYRHHGHHGGYGGYGHLGGFGYGLGVLH